MGPTRRTRDLWRNLAEQKSLLACLLIDTTPTFPALITHTLSLFFSFFFFSLIILQATPKLEEQYESHLSCLCLPSY